MTSGSAVRVIDVPPVRIAAVRRVVRRADVSRTVQAGCGEVWAFLRAQGVRGGRHVAVYHDASIRLEVGAEVNGAFTPSADVVESATPGGQVATATLLGPYDQLGAAHGAIQDWCTAHGLVADGPSWEVYGHWQPEWNDDPARIRTDVYYRVRAKTVGA